MSERLPQIVVATSNPAKVERYRPLLEVYADTVLGLRDLGVIEKPEETGTTAEENAHIKGRFYAEKTDFIVFSEDEALYVDFLPEDQQPGVFVRRINGQEVDDDTLLAHWEELLKDVPERQRRGRWHIAYCITAPNEQISTVALDHPIIFFSPSSTVRRPGWPMSSLEGPPDFGIPESELTDEQRQQLAQKANEEIAKALQELISPQT